MAPVMERGELAQVGIGVRGTTPSCLTTSLYDLIATTQDGLNPTMTRSCVATVVHLLRSRRFTWLGQARERLCHLQRAAMWAMPRVAPWPTAETSWSQGQR